MKIVNWRKSSYSATKQDCVTVGTAPGVVGVRDSKLPEDQPIIAVNSTAWRRFVTSVR